MKANRQIGKWEKAETTEGSFVLIREKFRIFQWFPSPLFCTFLLLGLKLCRLPIINYINYKKYG